MARLPSVNDYTYDGNKVYYGDFFSNNTTFPLNKRLKDDYFLFECHEKYARKKAKIYQGAYGDISLDSGATPTEILNTITIENNTARFMPIFAPDNNNGQAFYSAWEYDQTAINWEIIFNHDVRFSDFNTGDLKWGFEYTDKATKYQNFAPLTKWNVKKFLVLPIVLGVYSDGSLVGSEISHKHPTALDDFLSAPDTEIPPTDGYYTRIGFSYAFKIVFNGQNFDSGGMPMMLDCGYEINLDEMSSIMGGYGQIAGGIYKVAVFSNTIVDHKIYNPFNSANNLLGLCANITTTRGYSSDGIEYLGLATPVENVTNINRDYGLDARGICQIAVVGDLDYLYFTQTTYGIGEDDTGNHQIKMQIPVIKSQYMQDRNFLLDVALQMGIAVITDKATALDFATTNDVNEWWETNASKIIIPNIDMNTATVKQGGTPYNELPPDDERRNYLNSDDPFGVVPIMDTSDIDTNTYTEETPLNNPTITAAGKFNRYYALSQHDVDDLVDFLYTNNQSTISDILDGLKLNGENPMNFLISLKMFPFDLTEYGSITSEVIGFGNGVSTGITAEKLNDFTAILDLGSCTFRAYNGNFYDYEPYTTAKLYIPYCGEITVSTAQCVGHTISVKMIVDIITGSCCAVVFCDDIAIAYSNGNMSVEIPITGENATEYVSRGMSDISNMASGAVNAVSAGLQEGSTGTIPMLGGLAQFGSAVYDFVNMPTPLQTNGTSTAQTNFFKPQNCYFVVQSPVLLSTSGYGSHIGFACEYTAELNTVSGLTVCANVNNITPSQATEKEIDMIKNLLETGVIL